MKLTLNKGNSTTRQHQGSYVFSVGDVITLQARDRLCILGTIVMVTTPLVSFCK